MSDREVLPPVEDFSAFIGQPQMKSRLALHVRASILQTRPLEHILLAGPAGVGKSTLARLIAKELQMDPMILTMPMDRKALVRALQMFEGGVLFLDEIHALSKHDQEVLLPVLSESAVIDARGRRWEIPWLTVVGATTERDKLIAPLHQRFPIKPEFVPYTDSELGQIVAGMANRMGIELDEETARSLGTASGGVPRNAESLILTYRDLTATTRESCVTAGMVLDMCGVDPDGLTEQHRRELTILADQGGRAGQKTIELMLQVPGPVLRDLELLLLNRKLIEYTPTGRELTPAGMARSRGSEVPERLRR